MVLKRFQKLSLFRSVNDLLMQGLPNRLPGPTILMCRATSNCLGKARRATEGL